MANLPFPLFTCCKFIINDKIPNKDGQLFQLFTNTLDFKISSINPLVIEKDWPSQEDITKLIEALKGLLLLISKNCILEDNHGETSELRRTKENIKSGDLEQISPQKADVDKQLIKHTGIICNDASNKDTQAVGNNDVKYDSGAESKNAFMYAVKASLIDDIKMYFKDPHYDKYFNDVKKVDKHVIFTLNTCNDEDVSFLNTLNRLKVEECEFDHKDIRLNSAVEDMQVQTRELIIEIKDNKVHIVGLKDSVISAKKRLQLLLQNYDPKNSQHLDMVKVNKSTDTRKESLENPDTQRNKETTRKKMSHDEKTHDPRSSQKSEFNERHQGVPESPSDHHHYAGSGTYSGASGCSLFSNDQNIFYVGNEKSKLRVRILNTDITKLEVDCIVNAAHKRLQHGGGVAKAISLAAGQTLKKECEDFIQSGKQVAVTDIFVSTGGNMPAKCVLHAVGPKCWSYDDNSKSECLQDLRRTVIRCLVEADRRGFTSIALPSISAAIFRVPKEACAKCYMEAVKHFDKFNGEKTSLRDIIFVDVDETMVKIIQEHFHKNWTNPYDSHTAQKDCEFAEAHVFSAARNAARNTEKLPDTNKFTLSSSVLTKTPGAGKSSSVVGDRSLFGKTFASSSDLRTERSSVYQIGQFTLHTDPRPAFNQPADFTITVGKPFDKLSGLHDFNVASNKKEKDNVKNKYKLFSVSKPKGQQEKLVYAFLPEPNDTNTIKEAIGNLTIIMECTNYKMFKQTIRKVVLTSSILYNEPNNTQKKGGKHIFDRKKVGDFMRCLFEYLDHAPGNTASGISITVVGSEDALQTIHKVLESRGVKKISPEVCQGASSIARKPSSYASLSRQHSGYAVQGASYTKQHHEEVCQGASSIARKPSSYASLSRQYSGYAVQGASYTKQHHEEVCQGASSIARKPSSYASLSRQHSGYAVQGASYTKQHHEEVCQGASSIARKPSSYASLSRQHSGYAVQGASYTKQHHEEDVRISVDSEKACEICVCTKPLHPVRCCGKYLCQTCEQRMSFCPFCRTSWRVAIGDQPPGTMTVCTEACEICVCTKPLHPVRCCGKSMCQTCEQRMSICPFCRTFWRVSIGDQPPGTMTVCTINDHADGYENTRAWEIQYSLPSGVQNEHHPNPGKMYTSISRKAFIPMNEAGLYALKLLRLAFVRKLTFTIGRSLTMDREHSIIWNDIHHKTNLHGGTHGYPDSNYLLNVTQELAMKGVTFDTMSEDERYDLALFERCIVKLGHFSHPR